VTADVIIADNQFDAGISIRPDSRFCPNHVRDASILPRTYNPRDRRLAVSGVDQTITLPLFRTEGPCNVGTQWPLDSRPYHGDDRRFGFEIVTSDDLDRLGIRTEIAGIRRSIGTRPLYASADIDVLHPAHFRRTGTPESGRLSSQEFLLFIRGLRDLNLIGADEVEVSPVYVHAQVTTVAVSPIFYFLVSLLSILKEKHPSAEAAAATGNTKEG
jgi:arginase family enzyme